MPKRRSDTKLKAIRATKKVGVAADAVNDASTSEERPVKPTSLTGRAGVIWDEFAPALELQGMLTRQDALTFALWCRLGEKVEAGELTASLISQFRLLANDFGLSPSGKGRELGPIVPLGGGSKKSKFFND